jgi:hypothetical protein
VYVRNDGDPHNLPDVRWNRSPENGRCR